jgi:tetratricopeptide (TPR) repeat protein
MTKQGDLRGAIRTHEQTLAAYREMGDKTNIATVLVSLGYELEDHAELSRAHRSLDEAVRVSREIDQKFTTVSALTGLASVLADEGDLTAATKLCEEAMSISSRLSAKSRQGLPLLMLARLAVEKGQAADAETFAREALDRYGKEANPGSQASAYDALAQSYLSGAKIGEARDAVEHSSALAGQSVTSKLEVGTTAARARESQSRADAIKQLRSIVAEATKNGYLKIAFEARLPLAEIEIRSGEREMGRAHLVSLETEAAAKGFALLARKAQLALKALTSL